MFPREPHQDTLGFRVKKVCSLIEHHLKQLETEECHARTTFQLARAKLLKFAREVGELSNAQNLLKNLGDILLEVSPERRSLIQTARILIEELSTRFETDRYHFQVTNQSVTAFPELHEAKSFTSLRMQSASLIPDVRWREIKLRSPKKDKPRNGGRAR